LCHMHPIHLLYRILEKNEIGFLSKIDSQAQGKPGRNFVNN
jgi:hypothetical protein